ncbi:MAG: SIS domain-containing protein [Spirochaetaceae bacterium]|nr:SIS domain-containing protein [Spirochaetaceae bacterium]
MQRQSMEHARESIRIESNAIASILDYLDEDAFARAVDVMSKAERIATSACGNSGIAAKKLAHSLCCIEKPAKFIPPGEAVHGGLGFIKEGDVIVLASRGGKTAELLPIMRICRQKKATIICITENLDSPLAKGADIVLSMKVERESDKFNVMSTSSFVVLVAIFDALHVAIMDETGYSIDEFALIHPGGAVGERLNS